MSGIEITDNRIINTNAYQSISLVKEAFGIYARVAVFTLGDSTPASNKEQYSVSTIGTPVWDRVKLRNTNHDSLNYVNSDGELIVMPSYVFPETILIEASQSKDIVETKFAGGMGKTKEEISLDDYQIIIRGLIINYENKDYPVLQSKLLQGIFSRPLECGVESKYLNNVLKVYNLVFTEKSLKMLEGYGNIQPFELTAWSDEPIEFQLIKK